MFRDKLKSFSVSSCWTKQQWTTNAIQFRKPSPFSKSRVMDCTVFVFSKNNLTRIAAQNSSVYNEYSIVHSTENRLIKMYKTLKDLTWVYTWSPQSWMWIICLLDRVPKIFTAECKKKCGSRNSILCLSIPAQTIVTTVVTRSNLDFHSKCNAAEAHCSNKRVKKGLHGVVHTDHA